MVSETDYVNKSKVQGSSFEVGAKVTYEGREMTVSQTPDRTERDGDDIRMDDMSGFFALAAALPEAKSLRSIKCARAPPRHIKVSAPP